MVWWIKPLELADENGYPTGRWRVVETSDEDESLFYPMCECENGHESSEAAMECPIIKEKLGKNLPVEEPECGDWKDDKIAELEARITLLKEQIRLAEEDINKIEKLAHDQLEEINRLKKEPKVITHKHKGFDVSAEDGVLAAQFLHDNFSMAGFYAKAAKKWPWLARK
jgi:hypothetical protein